MGSDSYSWTSQRFFFQRTFFREVPGCSASAVRTDPAGTLDRPVTTVAAVLAGVSRTYSGKRVRAPSQNAWDDMLDVVVLDDFTEGADKTYMTLEI